MTEEMLAQEIREVKEMLTLLIERQQVREWYSVAELARLIGRAPFTCRAWCRRGRIRATKNDRTGAFTISHAELLRYQREGLLPTRA